MLFGLHLLENLFAFLWKWHRPGRTEQRESLFMLAVSYKYVMHNVQLGAPVFEQNVCIINKRECRTSRMRAHTSTHMPPHSELRRICDEIAASYMHLLVLFFIMFYIIKYAFFIYFVQKFSMQWLRTKITAIFDKNTFWLSHVVAGGLHIWLANKMKWKWSKFLIHKLRTTIKELGFFFFGAHIQNEMKMVE